MTSGSDFIQAWELGSEFGIENLKLVRRAMPVPGETQVRLRVLAASLNYRDLVVMRGDHGSAVTLPLIPISDGVGVVDQIGDAVTGLKVGDRVCPLFFRTWLSGDPPVDLYRHSLGGPRDGMLCTSMVVDAEDTVLMPDSISHLAAATLPCAGLTAWSALTDLKPIQPGETVLIQGTGGVALFALKFAKLMRARVIMMSSRDEKLDFVRELGADETINYRLDPDWHRTVKKLTHGKGCDRVLELGGAETLEKSLRAVKTGGLVILIGTVTGSVATVRLPLILTRNITLHSVSVGHKQAFERMVDAIEQHDITPIIDRVFPFDAANEAIEHLQKGRHKGKICVEIESGKPA
ncbi:MAG: NAD(P)-dependent alcohol dehydrogenase [Alphaproteobacteria bacterium]|jgi:NADPH:quinone reductase-like Zn-dependent oxidoreductase